MMNKDWVEKQAAKRASQEAAERIAAEQAAAQDAAEAAGVSYKRGRGRPVGSKTRNHRAGMEDLPPAETAQEVGGWVDELGGLAGCLVHLGRLESLA